MYAAGMTISEKNYPQFKEAFEQVVRQTMPEELRTPEVVVDCELDFKAITPRFFRLLKQFEPFGPGNMSPVFLAKNVRDTGFAKAIGNDKTHLKLYVSQQGISFGAVGFGLADRLHDIMGSKPFDAVYSVEENEWNGNVSLQLRLRHISPC